MAELSTIARPYAEAIFKLCPDSTSSQRWSDTLGLFSTVVVDPAMTALIGNPRVSATQLLGLFTELGGTQLDAEAHQLLLTLAENGRLAVLPEIRRQFAELCESQRGVVEAEIRSAMALSDAQVSDLVQHLQARFKKGIRPEVKIDPSLIGGVVVAVGDVVIDGSVRGRLDRMEAALKS